MNVKEFAQGDWLAPEDVLASALKTVVIKTEAKTSFDNALGHDVLECEVELDGKKFVWTLNKKNTMALGTFLGFESKTWVGQKVKLDVVQKNVRGVLKNMIIATGLVA